MNLQQEAIVDAELTTSDKFQETNTEKAGEVNSLDYSDTIWEAIILLTIISLTIISLTNLHKHYFKVILFW